MKYLKEKYIRWVGIPILGVIMNFVIKDEHEGNQLYHILISILFTAVFWNGFVIILRHYRKKFPEIKFTAKRLILTIASMSVFMIVASNILRLLCGYASFADYSDLWIILAHAQEKFIASFFVSSLYEAVYFFEQWKKVVKMNEELKNLQIRTQFEVLKNQMSPHFLFNSLNTLTTLISENQSIAIDFTHKLSEVYRYILQNKDKELVTLESELGFAKNYTFLLQMRYPENLTVNFDIKKKFSEQSIAPLTLQMLIENAIKHNVISKDSPLSISVEMNDDETIVVRNPLQRKNSIEKSTKTGLQNIRNRYKLLGNREIKISDAEGWFRVSIPLIRLMTEKEYKIFSEV